MVHDAGENHRTCIRSSWLTFFQSFRKEEASTNPPRLCLYVLSNSLLRALLELLDMMGESFTYSHKIPALSDRAPTFVSLTLSPQRLPNFLLWQCFHWWNSQIRILQEWIRSGWLSSSWKVGSTVKSHRLDFSRWAPVYLCRTYRVSIPVIAPVLRSSILSLSCSWLFLRYSSHLPFGRAHRNETISHHLFNRLLSRSYPSTRCEWECGIDLRW